MGWLRRIALALLGRFGASLRFPHLLLLAGAGFLLDLVVPDLVPFLDELMLGLMTLIFATWRKGRSERAESPEPRGPVQGREGRDGTGESR